MLPQNLQLQIDKKAEEYSQKLLIENAKHISNNYRFESGSNKDLKALQSFNLVDAGVKVLSENTISNFVTRLMSLMGRHVIDNRLYNRRYNTLLVESTTG